LLYRVRYTGRPLLTMGCLVFPLFTSLLLFLPSFCNSASVREFSPPDNHFPLSGFSHTITNHVDTQFSIEGLDDLPPPHEGQHPQDIEGFPHHNPTDEGPGTIRRNQAAAPPQFFPQNFFPHIQHPQTHQPSPRIPAPFDHFNNFFNIPHFQTGSRFPNNFAPTTPPPTTTESVTTPRTTPATKPAFKSTVKILEEEDILDKDLEYELEQNQIDQDITDYSENDADTYICPGSMKECLNACSPIITINQLAYKLCVNECLERCV